MDKSSTKLVKTRFLTIADFAKSSGIAAHAVRAAVRKGQLQAYQVGNGRQYLDAEEALWSIKRASEIVTPPAVATSDEGNTSRGGHKV